jgi:hypothetical protein
MARTIEELVLQRFERERMQQYFLYVKNVCTEASCAQQEAADERASVAGKQQHGNLAGCTSPVKHALEEADVHGALAVLLSATLHSTKFGMKQQSLRGLVCELRCWCCKKHSNVQYSSLVT